MLMNILIVAGAVAQAYGTPPTASPKAAAPAASPAPAAPARSTVAVPGRTLRDLPGVTITHYDIAGKTGPAIEKSLDKVLADPTTKEATRLFTWDVGTKIVKTTTGTKCVIQSATSTLTAKVRLPRLAEQAKVRKDVMANWTTYVTTAENDAAANLWFLSDRLRGAEQSLVGLPCDQGNPAWNAKLESVKAELDAFIAKRAPAAAKPAA